MLKESTAKRPYFYSSGKRKTSIARVKLYEDGAGKVTVNGRPFEEYFFGLYRENALAPLALTDRLQSFDVDVQLIGGGYASQSDAMRHGISRALIIIDPLLRSELKRAGYLRRDARIKERKKPGLKRARKAPQWAKR